ncbi:MAG: TIGR01459 family HAD-type hydrolase [Pseudomonadota bacterium]
MSARILASLAEIAADYDALFCDVWGVIHNGFAPFESAVAALAAYRQGGGKVVLLTNAPRPRADIEAQLDGIGVDRSAWDTVATSGDATRMALFSGLIGERVFFMGEERDLTVLKPMKLIENPKEIKTVPLEEAEGILCAGPEDPKADPETWRPTLLSAKARGLKLLCLNPDLVVDRGASREWCAGAVAAMYEEMGGEALYYGKPHAPIYELARARLAAIGAHPDSARILAVGDGIDTDVKGAMGEGLDCLFVTGGLFREETGTRDDPKADALEAFLNGHETAAKYAIGTLR